MLVVGMGLFGTGSVTRPKPEFALFNRTALHNYLHESLSISMYRENFGIFFNFNAFFSW